MAYENDPIEYVGATRKIPAVPKVTKVHATVVAHDATAFVDPIDEPEPVMPVVTKDPNLTAEGEPPTPAKKASGSHPKVAIKAPRLAYEAAVLEVQAARIELEQVTAAFRKAEHDEGARIVEWGTLNRREPDAVLREYLAREGALRLENCLAGRPANQRGPVTPTDQSPITLAALNRGRHAGGNRLQAGTPLRSNVVRRGV
jgi:hypothetical protein